MKKILFKLTILFLLAFAIFNQNTGIAKADDTTGGDQTVITPTDTPVQPVAYQIVITQNPSKITYVKGESLDLSDMVVTGYFLDGTTGPVTDYQIIGYDCNQVGMQTVIVTYQNLLAAFSVTVLPAKVTNVTVSDHNTGSFTLTWDAGIDVSDYEIYCLDDSSGMYFFFTVTGTNSITFSYPPGTIKSFRIVAVENILGIDYRSDLSDPIVAVTNPDMVSVLTVNGTTSTSINLSWTPAAGATGYQIYRSFADKDSYVLCASINTTSYTDEKLLSGCSYKYKVCAYVYSEDYVGSYSPLVDISTNPAKMLLKYKAGDGKVRITWPKVFGADSCEIFVGDDINGYTLLTSSNGNGGTYIAQELVMGNKYSFYAVAHRNYNGVLYDSQASDLKTIEITALERTSNVAKLFSKKADFLNSLTFKSLPFFSKYVNYGKSYIIPGLITTNVGGFSSIAMCPQGVTFAENYLLVSAYDLTGEENSVIYVMDKSTKRLLTTLILPTKPHAGGLCYDGFNIWVTNGTKVTAIPFSKVEEAVQSAAPYVLVDFSSVIPLGITTSYATYYDGKLWVGSYNELKPTNMYSYTIENKDTKPVLTKKDTIVMPTRVQGIAFSKSGILMISRSCQLYQGLRGYMRQIDTYKPDYKHTVNGVIPLGDPVNSVSMPSMNEDIAIDGSYLYVNFESGAFVDSTFKMDRICAFKLTDIAKKKV